jgi:hypothetical protein
MIDSLVSPALIAGAVGASLAILGNFWIQGAAARRDRRRYIAQLAANFLSHDASLISAFAQERSSNASSNGLDEIERILQLVGASSTELSLVAPFRVALGVQRVSGSMNALMVQSANADAETWRSIILDHGVARLELVRVVRRFVRSGRMTADEIGHDAIDRANPSTTHTPRSKRSSAQRK